MDMWNDFEEFTQGASSSRGNTVRASLNNRGDITLNQLAVEKLAGVKKVVLAFSKQKGLIGIRSAREDENHALEVKKLPKSNTYVIRSKAFCNFYNIIPKQTISFDEIVADEVGMILDLNKVTLLAPRTRRKRTVEEPKPVEQPKLEAIVEQNDPPKFAWQK